VAVWRSTYAGLVPDEVLQDLSVERRQTMWTDILTAHADILPALVAEESGIGICGFGNCGTLRGDPVPGFDGEFKTLYLLPAYQRRGIGRGLFCRSATLLAERGYGSAIAWVLAGNPAFAFYEAMGGKVCAQRADEVFGAAVQEIGYGWTDLLALARRATA
jgi:ribosomal protein S18 acetylase RimI-like enzyme